MNLTEYTQFVQSMDIHPEEGKLWAHKLGLVEEVGEFCGKLCKAHRKGVEPDRKSLLLEIGDICWRAVAIVRTLDDDHEIFVSGNMPKADLELIITNIFRGVFSSFYRKEKKHDLVFQMENVLDYCAALAEHYGSTLEEVLQMNHDKLTDRKDRNKIIGEGDYR